MSSMIVAETPASVAGHEPVSLRRLHICFIVGTLGQGGAERQLYYIVRSLVPEGHAVTLLCLTAGEYWEERLRETGATIVWVGTKESRLFRVGRIIREARRIRPDIIQSSHFYTNLYAVVAGRVLGIPAIGALRGDGYSEVSETGRLWGTLNLRTPRLLAGNSRNGIKNAVALGRSASSCTLLPNVVDSTYFKSKCSNGDATEKPTLLAAGRLVPQKRMDRFLRLIHVMRSTTHSGVQGIIAGDGPLRDDLQRLAEELNLAGAVTFSGTVPDMRPLYEQADIFVLTSDHEGTPNVVMEAMASGLPVVATNAGGTSDLIEDGVNGFIADKENEQLLQERVRFLLTHPQNRVMFGKRARDFIERNHSTVVLPGILQRLYAGLA